MRSNQKIKLNLKDQIRPTWKDSLITLALLGISTLVGLLFTHFGFSEANIITVYILGVLIIAVFTLSPIYGIISSLASVLLFNWFYIEPRFSFHTYETEYVVTFVIMLISSLIAGSRANKLKKGARQSSREAFRAKVLFDTNQLIQKAECADDVIKITAQQVKTLLDRDVEVLPASANMEPVRESMFDHSWYEGGKSLYQPIIINGYCYVVIAIHLNGESL